MRATAFEPRPEARMAKRGLASAPGIPELHPSGRRNYPSHLAKTERRERAQGAVGLAGPHDHEESEPHVEGARHLGWRDPSRLGDELEDARRCVGIGIELDAEAVTAELRGAP